MNNYMGDPTQKLLTEYLEDEDAFRSIFEYYYADLCVYARRYIVDLATREDLVQDTFCSIWMNRKKVDYSVPLTNYLITCVKNNCLNYLRKNSKEEYGTSIENLPLYADDFHHLFHLHELEEKFNEILSGLPEEYRIAFVMSRIENRSSAEIAGTLGVSVRTVERYRNKAVDILQSELKEYLPLLAVILQIRF